MKDKIIQLFNSGFKAKQISSILKIDRRTAAKYIKKAGYSYSSCNKADINSLIFSRIDTEEKAYWLGFLYADGCVMDNGSVELSLKLSDLPHLQKFQKFLSFSGKIYTDSFRCRLCFRDKKIANDLISLGCLPRKSLILKFPTENQVNENLVNHFIRGYFDGDGYVRRNGSIEVSMSGTFEMLEYLKNTVKINRKVKPTESKIYCVSFTGNDARNFLDMIYSGSSIYLDRKYEIYESRLEDYKTKRMGRNLCK